MRTEALRDLRDRCSLGVTHTVSALPVSIGDLLRKVENEALVLGELLWCRLALEQLSRSTQMLQAVLFQFLGGVVARVIDLGFR